MDATLRYAHVSAFQVKTSVYRLTWRVLDVFVRLCQEIRVPPPEGLKGLTSGLSYVHRGLENGLHSVLIPSSGETNVRSLRENQRRIELINSALLTSKSSYSTDYGLVSYDGEISITNQNKPILDPKADDYNYCLVRSSRNHSILRNALFELYD
ncbi:unnamed protein product [Nesidiocoris tenuis]|uniref:Uncharacterized protein n=1 Tax=Nesidiocoris tenuis TaxID=355587 RepID=A0A6H5G0L1_9HEMI|nr:unnamed protein product [Nesidiocoris tenuis]